MAETKTKAEVKEAKEEKEATKSRKKLINDYGNIHIIDMADKSTFHKTLTKIAQKHKMEHPETLAKIAIQMATPKKHPQYMPTVKICNEMYPEKVATQSVQMKVGSLLEAFVQECFFSVERDQILKDIAEQEANRTDKRKRLTPEEKTAREAAKYVNSEFRKMNKMQTKGAIPKDKREMHEKYVKDNIENVVKKTYKDLYKEDIKNADKIIELAIKKAI